MYTLCYLVYPNNYNYWYTYKKTDGFIDKTPSEINISPTENFFHRKFFEIKNSNHNNRRRNIIFLFSENSRSFPYCIYYCRAL